MTTARLAPRNRISSFILFMTVAAAPFPFGSTAPYIIAFWCFALGLGAIALSTSRFRREHLPLLGVAFAVVLAYAFVLHEQLSANAWLAPPNPVWKASAEAMQSSIVPSASIARNQPFLALSAPLANILAIVSSFILCLESARARQLLRVIAWSGAAYAVYGIAAYLIDPTRILWREAPPLHTLSSTFEYRSTACVYFGACAVVWLVLSWAHLGASVSLDSVYWKSGAI